MFQNLSNLKIQICHQKLIFENFKNHLLDKVENNPLLIVPKNQYKSNRMKEVHFQERRKSFVDTKI